MDATRMQGIIKSYLGDKGYGFISGDDGKDYFFHVNSIKNKKQQDEIADGLSVKFNGVPTPKGYSAKSIEFEIDPQHLKYKVPDKVEISKTSEVPNWQRHSLLHSSLYQRTTCKHR